MRSDEAVRAVLIHLVTPAAGITLYVWLYLRMRRAVLEPPYFAYFFLFATIGGWLLVALTALFWFWSVMATLGTFYLLLVSPFIAAGFAFVMFPEQSESRFHLWAVRLCFGYAVAVFVLDVGWIVWSVTQNT